MAQKRITDLPQTQQITDASKFYIGEQIKDYHGTFAQIKTALSHQQILDRLQLLEDNLIGTIQIFAGESFTQDYLLCDGQEYLKTDYPKLYAKIGDVYGNTELGYTEPSSEEHFRVPNLLDRFLRNTDGTRPVGTNQTDTMREIEGKITFRNGASSPLYTFNTGSFQQPVTGSGTQNYNNNATSSDSSRLLGVDFRASTGIVVREDEIQQDHISSEFRPENTTVIMVIKAK